MGHWSREVSVAGKKACSAQTCLVIILTYRITVSIYYLHRKLVRQIDDSVQNITKCFCTLPNSKTYNSSQEVGLCLECETFLGEFSALITCVFVCLFVCVCLFLSVRFF